MKLSLRYPVSPVHVNQAFGGNAVYYSTLPDQYGNPQKGHPGVDLMAVHGQPVYAPIGGTARYLKDSHGGEGVWIFTGPYDYYGGTCWFNVIHWHLIGDTDANFPQPFPGVGIDKVVQAGDLIGYADNTGAPYESSGDHLHFGLMPCDQNGLPLLKGNGYGGCIDPVPYLGTFSFQKNLYFGLTDPDVVQLQSKLGVIQSGFFGSLTFKAVVAYQSANGVVPTGFVGPLTRAKLNATL